MTEKREPPFKLDMGFGEALSRYARIKSGEMLGNTSDREQSEVEPTQGELELVHYQTVDCAADFTLDPTNETVWATEQQMATLFGVGVPAISKHVNNIYSEAELFPEGTFSKLEIVRQEGSRSVKRQIDHYNLDMILSVGYRVSSQKATAFRRWATQTLKDYIVQGFALNEARLRDDPRALRELAAKVRKLRADEKTVYASVRDVFAFASSDYVASSQAAQSFFAVVTDKFLFAVTGKQAAELVLERASAAKPNMGVQSMKGDALSKQDIHIGKNYLDGDELYMLHILCEMWLLFVESAALRGMKLTMSGLSQKFDELLRVQGHAVFSGYKEFLRDRAKLHAEREFTTWAKQTLPVPAPKKRLKLS